MYILVAIEGEDVLTPKDTKNMKLPFTRGWDSWGMLSPRGHVVFKVPEYDTAKHVVDLFNERFGVTNETEQRAA